DTVSFSMRLQRETNTDEEKLRKGGHDTERQGMALTVCRVVTNWTPTRIASGGGTGPTKPRQPPDAERRPGPGANSRLGTASALPRGKDEGIDFRSGRPYVGRLDPAASSSSEEADSFQPSVGVAFFDILP